MSVRPTDGAGERLGANRNEQLALGDRDAEGHPPFKTRDERRDERTVEGIELESVRPVNPLAGELPQQLHRVLVGVDRDAWGGLARSMQTRRVWRADLDPGDHSSRQVAYGDRRFVRFRHTAGELDAVDVLEQIGEDARYQVFLGFGRMARHAQRQRFVDLPVGIGQLDVEVVNRCAECHEVYVTGHCPALLPAGAEAPAHETPLS